MNARTISLAIAFLLLATVPVWIPGIYYVNVASQVLIFRPQGLFGRHVP